MQAKTTHTSVADGLFDGFWVGVDVGVLVGVLVGVDVGVFRQEKQCQLTKLVSKRCKQGESFKVKTSR